MSDDGIHVLLFDDGKGTRYAIPMDDLPNFRLPDDADLDLEEADVEGFQITNPRFPPSSSARVRGPHRYVPTKGWGINPGLPNQTGLPAMPGQ